MSNNEKYVLCRPQGGLNDIFNQIEKCRKYAERYGRTLIVDTNYDNAIHFRDNFGFYFTSNLRYMKFLESGNQMYSGETSVLPAVLSGRLHGYPFNFDRDAMCYVESETKTPLTFDFSIDHDERILVHHTGGGGTDSLQLMRCMSMSETLAKEIVRRRKLLGESYIAVHARNTDLISNYRPIIADIRARGYGGQILVCTDDRNVVDEFRSELKDADVVSLANLDTGKDRRIHFVGPSDNARERNIDAICDLMLLALSNELFVAHLLPNEETPGGFSGFSLLAGMLHREPATLWALLGPTGNQIRPRSGLRGLRNRVRQLRMLGERFLASLKRG